MEEGIPGPQLCAEFHRCGFTAPEIVKNGNFWYKFAHKGNFWGTQKN